MIAHKYPGILLELTSAEVIWLHYTKFFMELEAEFESCMHVYKEPTGVYYKLTGNFSPKILEEARQKTLTQVNKNKIEMLKSDLDAKHYPGICVELRLKFPRVYIQLLPYNVFDQLSRRLHDKFGYKQALQDFAELTKKKKKFCFLVCDKVHFSQVKEAFHKIIEPLEQAGKVTAAGQLTQQQQQTLNLQQNQALQILKQSQIMQNKTWINPSDYFLLSNSNSDGLNSIPVPLLQQSASSGQGSMKANTATIDMKKKNLKTEFTEPMMINIHNLDNNSEEDDDSSDVFEGVDMQKEDFPCLLDMQKPTNPPNSATTKQPESSSSSVSSSIATPQKTSKKDGVKRRANRKLKKKMQAELLKAAVAAAAAQQQGGNPIAEKDTDQIQNLQKSMLSSYPGKAPQAGMSSSCSEGTPSQSPNKKDSPSLSYQFLQQQQQQPQQQPIQQQLEGIDDWEIEFLAMTAKSEDQAVSESIGQPNPLVSQQNPTLQLQPNPQKPPQQQSSSPSPPLLDTLSYSTISSSATGVSSTNMPRAGSSASNVSDKALKMLSKMQKSEPFHPDKQEIKPQLQNYLLEEQFHLSECLKQSVISSTSSSETFKVSYKENLYCLKVFKNLSPSALRLINAYSENLRKTAAPRIIRLFGKTVTKISANSSMIHKSSQDSQAGAVGGKLSRRTNGCFEVALLLELKDKNLQQAIIQGGISTLDEKIYVFWQIAVGLQQLHCNSMCHGNLKSSNVLLSTRGRVQLSDFFVNKGIANENILKDEQNACAASYSTWNSNMVNPSENDQQTLKSHRTRVSADVWCLGLLGYFIFTHHEANAETALKLIKQSAFINTLSTPKNPSVAEVFKLILQMTDLVPERRPQVEQVLNSLTAILPEKYKETACPLSITTQI